MSFGKFLRSARKERGLKQSELADALHVSAKTVSAWEQDRNKLPPEMFRALGEALDCSERKIFLAWQGEETKKRIVYHLVPREEYIRSLVEAGWPFSIEAAEKAADQHNAGNWMCWVYKVELSPEESDFADALQEQFPSLKLEDIVFSLVLPCHRAAARADIALRRCENAVRA